MRIFTKIESIRPCHTPDLSTKFQPKLPTTLREIVIYITRRTTLLFSYLLYFRESDLHTGTEQLWLTNIKLPVFCLNAGNHV